MKRKWYAKLEMEDLYSQTRVVANSTSFFASIHIPYTNSILGIYIYVPTIVHRGYNGKTGAFHRRDRVC